MDIIDPLRIVSETKEVFFKTEEQQKKYSEIKQFVSEEEYKVLHKQFLTPLDLQIDVDAFIKEIQQYDKFFEQWGTEYRHMPRFGLALINQNGVMTPKDPINGSLYEWNKNNPDRPLLESDCRTPTKAMEMNSLKPLEIFKNYWYRSNILKWYQDAEFKPHIDTILPSPWLRLWGATDPSLIQLRYWSESLQEMVVVTDIQPGRIYLIDTSIVHDAKSFGKVFQFFLSVNPICSKKIRALQSFK